MDTLADSKATRQDDNTIVNHFNHFNQCNQSQWNEIKESGIADDVAELAIVRLPDVEVDPITKEVIATPLSDALGYRYTRFTHQAKPDQHGWGFKQDDGDIWQVKVIGEFSNGKTGQYLAKKGVGDVPYLPSVPTRVVDAIANRYGVDKPDPGQPVWDWVKDSAFPVILTEGGKKSLSAISQGYAAISLFGCSCGKTPTGIKDSLLPYVEERPVIIGFDQDSKPNTKLKVNRSIRMLGSRLKRVKSSVKVATWDNKDGKGLDDLIGNELPIKTCLSLMMLDGSKSLLFLSSLLECYPSKFKTAIANAKPLDQWKLEQDFNLDSLASLRVNTSNLTDVIKSLPDSKLNCIQSPYKTFKTQLLSELIRPHLNEGGKVIVPPHRVQLAKQLGDRLGVEYRTELTKEGKLFGYALVIDSLHPNASPPFNPDNWEGCWVILDEIDQVCWHVLNSPTCEYNRPSILSTLAELLNVADKIFLTSNDLSRVDIKWINGMLIDPVTPYVIVNDYKPKTRKAYTFEDFTSLYGQAVKMIEDGKKLLIHVGGQRVESNWGSINMEKMLKATFQNKKILRVDRESIADPTHPAYGCISNINVIFSQYDIVICSPTIETGISIENNHFDAVFLFGTGSQTVDAMGQTIERERSNIDRYICVSEQANFNLIGNGSSDAFALVTGQNKRANLIKQLTKADDIASFDIGCDSNHLRTWAKYAAKHNYGFKNYRQSFYELLTKNGFELFSIVECTEDEIEMIKESAKATVAASKAEYYQKVASAPIIEDDNEYKELINKRAKTEPERLTERASTISRKYCVDAIDTELIEKDATPKWYGRLRLHYLATIGNQFVTDGDRNAIKGLAKSNGKAFIPDINKKTVSAKIKAIHQLGIADFLDGDRTFSSNDADLIEWHSRMCSYANDMKNILGIGISSNPEAKNNSPIHILKRCLLNLFGLNLVHSHTDYVNGAHIKIYKIESLDPDGRLDIFNRWCVRDSENFSDSSNQSDSLLERIKNIDTSLHSSNDQNSSNDSPNIQDGMPEDYGGTNLSDIPF